MPGKINNLESKNWVAGGNVAISLDGLEPQTRVDSIELMFQLNYSKSTADTLSAYFLAKAINNIKLGTYFNLSGQEIYALRWHMNGRQIESAYASQSISAGATTGQVQFSLTIPLKDWRQSGSNDGALPTELLASKNIEVTFDSATVWQPYGSGGNTLQITSGIVRASVYRINGTCVPQLNRIGYFDQSSLTLRLPAGIYKDIIVTQQNGANITPALVSVVDIEADGILIAQNVRFEQLIALWNRNVANGNGQGYELDGVAGAPFLPLYWLDRTGKSNLTQNIHAEKDVLIRIVSGTLTNGRFTFSQALQKDNTTVTSLVGIVGAPAGAQVYEPDTASGSPVGSPLNSKKTRAIYGALPAKLRSRPSPGNTIATAVASTPAPAASK